MSELVVKAFREAIAGAAASSDALASPVAAAGGAGAAAARTPDVVPIDAAAVKALPGGRDWRDFLYPVDAIGKMSFDASLSAGCGRPKVMYAHSPMDNPLPFEALLLDAAAADAHPDQAERRQQGFAAASAAVERLCTVCGLVLWLCSLDTLTADWV